MRIVEQAAASIFMEGDESRLARQLRVKMAVDLADCCLLVVCWCTRGRAVLDNGLGPRAGIWGPDPQASVKIRLMARKPSARCH